MSPERTTLVASAIVALTGLLWGFYWLPVRRLSDSLPGAWGSFAILAVALTALLPFAMRNRRAFRHSPARIKAAICLGGFAFFLYSIAFTYGRVAVVILLFFLTPVWSVLIGRVLMGWPISLQRMTAVALGLAGLLVMLGADGGSPVPRGTGEWLALASGLLWSVSTTIMRTHEPMPPLNAGFLFALGGTLGAVMLTPLLSPWPAGVPLTLDLSLLTWAAAGGLIWFGLSVPALMWATQRLEPARVGILLMTEVLVGAVSAALLAGESLSPFELIGGLLVIAAGLLEVIPLRRR